MGSLSEPTEPPQPTGLTFNQSWWLWVEGRWSPTDSTWRLSTLPICKLPHKYFSAAEEISWLLKIITFQDVLSAVHTAKLYIDNQKSYRYRVFMTPIALLQEKVETITIACCTLHNFLHSQAEAHTIYLPANKPSNRRARNMGWWSATLLMNTVDPCAWQEIRKPLEQTPQYPISARFILKYGADLEGYRNSEMFIEQVKKACTISKFKYPLESHSLVWLFDQSSGQTAYPADALNINKMNNI